MDYSYQFNTSKANKTINYSLSYHLTAGTVTSIKGRLTLCKYFYIKTSYVPYFSSLNSVWKPWLLPGCIFIDLFKFCLFVYVLFYFVLFFPS